MKYNVFKTKLIIHFVITLLLFQLIPLISSDDNTYIENRYQSENTYIHIALSEISVITNKNYTEINFNSNSTKLMNFGQPMIPIISKTFVLPFGSKITSINLSYDYTHSIYIRNKIKPAFHPIPKTINQHTLDWFISNDPYEDPCVYNSSNAFPLESYNYTIGCGIQNNSRVIFLTIHFYPIRYFPSDHIIQYGKDAEINISYLKPTFNPIFSKEYDLIIICPTKYAPSLQPLSIHKNNNGIKTKIKTIESIYFDSVIGKYDNIGQDEPEKIKYFIKYAIEKWNISYVLLVGGHKKQRQSWNVPVRYSNLHDRSFWNDTYITDLYYADIYRYNQSIQDYEFEDWDSNNNKVIGEWTWIFDSERGWWYDQDKKDNLDLFPDVYLGRLSCRDISEVKSIVNKIIKYEKRTSGKQWFQKIICVGGDTVPYSDGICEGEIETNLGANYLSSIGFNATKLWVSNQQLTGSSIVRQELNKGAGFIYLSGHGTPIEWCTHPTANGNEWIDVYAYQLSSLLNFNKLPICIVGGCHNSQIDVALINIIKGLKKYGISYLFWDEGIECFPKWTWAPECWSWNLVSQKNGGFIATIGNTGLGWGVGGENCIEYNEGYLTTHFFQVYANSAQNDVNTLGIIHSETINDYIMKFSANDHVLDRKTIEQWILLGDPSLTIGGMT